MEVGFHTIHFSPMFGGSAQILDVIGLTADAGFGAIGLDQASVAAHVAANGAVEDVAAAIARSRAPLHRRARPGPGRR